MRNIGRENDINLKPALNGLDNKLEGYLNYKNGFFIEAGANDGYSQSNTNYLEKKKNGMES